MKEAMQKYIEAICADYRDWHNRSNSSDEIKNRMIKEFEDSVYYKEGKKYIKVIKDGSVHSFIVAGEDKAFKIGDILKPAGYATPARNAARGNIFEEYSVRWTGPNYLK